MTRRRWIKLWTQETLYGTTSRELDLAEQAIWFKFLAAAGDSPEPGRIEVAPGVPYTIEQLAKIVGAPVDLLRQAMAKMIVAEKITVNSEIILITNFDRYQAEFDRRDYMRAYMKERRKREKGDVKPVNPANVNPANGKSANGKTTPSDHTKPDHSSNIPEKEIPTVSPANAEPDTHAEKRQKPKQAEAGVFLDMVEQHIGTKLVQRPKLMGQIRPLLVKFPEATPEGLLDCFKWLKQHDPYCQSRDSPMVISMLAAKYPEWAAGKLPAGDRQPGLRKLPTGEEIKRRTDKFMKGES